MGRGVLGYVDIFYLREIEELRDFLFSVFEEASGRELN